MTPGNTEKHRNRTGGASKEKHSSNTSKQIQHTEFRKVHASKEVQDHICLCEEKFKSAHEWAFGETGQGMLEHEGLISHKEKVVSRFE